MEANARTVTIIKPSIDLSRNNPFEKPALRKVAAYARVSTDSDEQYTSYEKQVEYYTDYIRRRGDEWVFVGVYADEGITGTNTKKRDSFNRMVRDALDGKIDLIITKSVSRFARNTVDSLQTVRRLKEHNVEVFFENDNIWTFDAQSEMLLTFLSSLAQEGSRSISENVTWGHRARFAEGKFSLAYSRFLGYTKGPDGTLAIVEDEAKTVRDIYRLFLYGKAPLYIANHLTKRGIPTPGGKPTWRKNTIESILTNEKHRGSALLQKTYTVDFLTGATKKNDGSTIPQYYVEKSPPPIIDPETFDLVQYEFERRKNEGLYAHSNHFYSGRVMCGDCGGMYRNKVLHGNDPRYRRDVIQCGGKNAGRRACRTPYISEDELKAAFVRAFNLLVGNSVDVVSSLQDVLGALTDTTTLDAEQRELTSEAEVITGLVREIIKENSRAPLDQEEYRRRYDGYMARYEKAQARLCEITKEIKARTIKRARIKQFLKNLNRYAILTEFDEEAWYTTVEAVTVYRKKRMTFVFKDGTAIDIEPEV